jgi:hypothetical protein
LSVAFTWGTAEAERRLPFPCDTYVPQADAVYFRGITVRAPRERLFRWLCQMRVAPYSYDWIDNRGRRSPRTLTPSLEHLAIGQSMMGVFTIVDFAGDRHITLRIKQGTGAFSLFGDLALTYLVMEESPESCRLLVKMVVRYPRGTTGAVMRRVLPWGDLLMMRRQLLNFKALAEAEG